MYTRVGDFRLFGFELFAYRVDLASDIQRIKRFLHVISGHVYSFKRQLFLLFVPSQSLLSSCKKNLASQGMWLCLFLSMDTCSMPLFQLLSTASILTSYSTFLRMSMCSALRLSNSILLFVEEQFIPCSLSLEVIVSACFEQYTLGSFTCLYQRRFHCAHISLLESMLSPKIGILQDSSYDPVFVPNFY